MSIKIQKLGIKTVPPSLKNNLEIHEGKYKASNGGNYYFHLVKISGNFKADFVAPEQFQNKAFLKGWDHAIVQDRIPYRTNSDVYQKAWRKIHGAGEKKLNEYLEHHPEICFISDASNYPINAGNFPIMNGKMLALPENSEQITGKHYILNTDKEGNISFPLIDFDKTPVINNGYNGFFVANIIQEGKAIRLLDEVPGTGQLSIFNFRGHIKQIFNQSAYWEGSKQRLADINTQLLEYLKHPKKYRSILENIIGGRSVDIGNYKNLTLPLNVYNHTYWIRSDDGKIYCFKTYPYQKGLAGTISNNPPKGGETFNEGPDLLFAIAAMYKFRIHDAFIGTSGNEVRIMVNDLARLVPITNADDGHLFTAIPQIPLANFIAFLR